MCMTPCNPKLPAVALVMQHSEMLGNVYAQILKQFTIGSEHADLWKQAESNTITPKPLTDYGWMVVEGKLSVEWDSPSNMDEVQERVAGLLKGCGCKTGCQTHQCGCRAKGKACGEGCNCLNCTNTGPQAMSQYTSNTEFASLEEIMEESIPEDMDELMGWVFGENADTVTEQNEETEDDND